MFSFLKKKGDAPAEAIATPTAPADPAATSWRQRLFAGLSRTRAQLGGKLKSLFARGKVDDELLEELETLLLTSDIGIEATQHLLTALQARSKKEKLETPEAIEMALAECLLELLLPLEQPLELAGHKPFVIMIAGVNGAGKTTSIGKLARYFQNQGKSVLLAAGDTFRAAAREQLAVWADRNQVEIISQQDADPSAVAFDAVAAGRARGRDVVLVDTAGRLPTQKHLMEELAKIRRVVTKADVTAPHEVLLVIDGNTGQNALAQVKAFDEAAQLTGLIVTKLDGTAKGGVLCAIAREKPVPTSAGSAGPLPVYFIGVGEKLEDLQTFKAREFAQALVG